MPALHHDRWEAFARECARRELAITTPGKRGALGQARTAAYQAAGFMASPNAQHNARRLANVPAVRRRIAELVCERLEHADIRPERVAVRVDRIARARVTDIFEKDGRTVRPLKDLEPELQEAIKSVEWINEGNDEAGKPMWRCHVEFYDKLQANVALLRAVGVIADDPQPGQAVSIFNVLSIDDQRALAAALTALPAGPDDPAGSSDREHQPA